MTLVVNWSDSCNISDEERSLIALVGSIWSKVFSMSRQLATTDDFFSLGGDSLIALRIVRELLRAT